MRALKKSRRQTRKRPPTSRTNPIQRRLGRQPKGTKTPHLCDPPCQSCGLTMAQIGRAISVQLRTGELGPDMTKAEKCRDAWCREKQAMLLDHEKRKRYLEYGPTARR